MCTVSPAGRPYSACRPCYTGPLPSCSDRLALFRSAWLLRRSLQWRQLWPLLHADADRIDLESRLIELLPEDRALVSVCRQRRLIALSPTNPLIRPVSVFAGKKRAWLSASEAATSNEM
jgi:hypothetical protein